MKNKYKDLTIILVTFHSSFYLNKILNKLKSLRVVIVENSDNIDFKENIEKKYKNVNCILSGSNIGFGCAINLAIKRFNSKFYLIVNPDCEFDSKVIYNLYNLIKTNKKITAISPTTIDKKNRIAINHGYFISTLSRKNYYEDSLIKQVDFFIGHFFLINGNILKKIAMFDENIFLNYEEIDVFKRLKKYNHKIFIHKKSFVKHLDGQSGFKKNNKSETIHEMTKSSKWHLAWSKFYYYKKNYNYLVAIIVNLNFFTQNILKYLYFFLIRDVKKKQISLSFIKGTWSSLLNKKSFYRPII